jgi:N-acetylmuramic acid 6-phosphate etherase
MMKHTEATSLYNNLEQKSIAEILISINNEDAKVALVVAQKIAQIEKLVAVVVQQLKNGGRLFYIGAGTSGRLGIVDASECPPTFGVSHNTVIGIIAGGDSAIRNAVEFAEDDVMQGWKDLQDCGINKNDVVIGIAASGTTPYVIAALKECNNNNIATGCITCNENTPLAAVAIYPIEIIVGPEFITGSTRMKSGTAQKMVLNMISTTTMIQLGRVEDNKMVHMQLTNDKLIDRGLKMIMAKKGISIEEARNLLNSTKDLNKALK